MWGHYRKVAENRKYTQSNVGLCKIRGYEQRWTTNSCNY